MPGGKKVGELMVSLAEYPFVYDTDSLKDAVRVLKEYLNEGKSHRSLLVFSKTKKVAGEKELVGILTVRDILNTIKKNRKCPGEADIFMSWALFYHKDVLEECLVTTVGRAVRPLVKAFVQADDSVTKAVELMMNNNVNLLPVFENKKAVGVIRALDILDYIGELVES
ncbi:CBS domain-containing protein [Desulfotomaculum copahuensis]|uniref:Histidine kinase n=1 Tax=Desulfotomaculum copahuensis TaxID=1838280 RepID=A0A1B7LI63_9FIRM|nr:CBS domain-containing protein [Desulfotomaculum copahuensis]OAT85893.1 histidine kinase [Desulfotomaculum copahuensis]